MCDCQLKEPRNGYPEKVAYDSCNCSQFVFPLCGVDSHGQLNQEYEENSDCQWKLRYLIVDVDETVRNDEYNNEIDVRFHDDQQHLQVVRMDVDNRRF